MTGGGWKRCGDVLGSRMRGMVGLVDGKGCCGQALVG